MNTHFNGVETLMPEGVAGASGTRMPSHLCRGLLGYLPVFREEKPVFTSPKPGNLPVLAAEEGRAGEGK